MLSSSYLSSILDPQTVSCSCSLILKVDTPTLTTVNGELKVCYSAVNAGLTSFKWIRSVSHFEKLCLSDALGWFSPIELWYKHRCSDSAAFKRETVSDSALNAPSHRPSSDRLVVPDSWNVPACVALVWLVLTLSPHLLLLIPLPVTPDSHQLVQDRGEMKRRLIVCRSVLNRTLMAAEQQQLQEISAQQL